VAGGWQVGIWFERQPSKRAQSVKT